MLETTRTYRGNIVNHSQVSGDLDECGHSASKLLNVARYHSQQEWDETREIPSEADLKRELKNHERYSDLHSQSSQRVLEELAEASYTLRKCYNVRTILNALNEHQPPSYRLLGRFTRNLPTPGESKARDDSKQFVLGFGSTRSVLFSLSDSRSINAFNSFFRSTYCLHVSVLSSLLHSRSINALISTA